MEYRSSISRSLLLAEQSHTSQTPLVNHSVLFLGHYLSAASRFFLLGLGTQVDLGNQVAVLAHGVFVDWAWVHALFVCGVPSRCTGSLLFGGRALGEDLNVGERVEQILALGVFDVALGLVPRGTFEEETMDPAAF